MKTRNKSKKIYEEMSQIIPGGVNSPVRTCSHVGQLPMVAESAKGDLIYDADGQEYIDFCGSWGALLHGHSHPIILDAVQRRMSKGTSFGITTEIEGDLAREIIKCMPGIEKIRFVSSGTEATMSAVRLARGFTGRDLIVKFSGNYHGHADFFLIQAGSGVIGLPQSSSKGIPQQFVSQTICLPYNDETAIRQLFQNPDFKNKIAAVIIEPVAGNMGVVEPAHGFLTLLRELTEKNGSLLIFDEVITGFRIGLGGAQALYQVKPDLTCLGKIIAGGFPAAAFGGRREIMDQLAPLGPIYQAGTLSGNPLAMEAGLQALKLLQKPNFYKELESKTKLLLEPVKKAIAMSNKKACIQQVGSMFTLFFGTTKVENMKDAQQADTAKFAEFFRYLFDHGVYFPPAQHEAAFISMAHTEEHLERTRDLIIKFIENL